MQLKKIENKLHIFSSNKMKWWILVFLAVVVLNFIIPLPSLRPYSKAIYAKDGTLLTAFLSVDDKWRLETNFEEVSPELVKAIIYKEDKWFYWHFGVNPVAIIKSFFTNIKNGRVLSGASTITMQVVRILEPRKRTYLNKFIEILRAIQLEFHYTKDEILGIYLSHLPLGGNIEGVKSASYIYFNHPPETLSISQAILLSIIPGDPNSLRLDRWNEKIISKRNYWIKRFLDENIFQIKELNDALNETITPSRYPIPVIAPHFCNYLKSKVESDRIESTLDLNIQPTTENILWNYINNVRGKRISNGAVIVVDNHNSEVVAYCGSADFYNTQSSGQVNGIISERSPGSTLKPALYALCFETGFLTPAVKLLDVPIEIGGYEPENFDQKHYGLVSAGQALVNSLNIPAVELLDKIGVKNFIEFLESANFTKIKKNKDKLGLSLILGGCGVTLEELTTLYSSFANQGLIRKLKYSGNQDEESPKQLFSPETAYLIAEILSSKQRNDMIREYAYSSLPKFAWKTGTSFGKRDGWSIGFNPNYTIGVWVGNFDGSGSAFLTGAEAALPLLVDLFNAIDYKSKIKWFEKPKNVYTRDVCSESGLLPTTNCQNLVKDFAILNRSHNLYCDVHQEIYLNEDETIQYCKQCLSEKYYKKKVYSIQKPELIAWLSKNNIPFEIPPPHNSECSLREKSEGLKIISPSANFEYYIDANDPQEIILLAASEPDVRYQYWYVNNRFIKKCYPGEKVYFKPDKEKLKVVCMDDRGRVKSVSVVVKKY